MIHQLDFNVDLTSFHPISKIACNSRKTRIIYSENIYHQNQEDVAT